MDENEIKELSWYGYVRFHKAEYVIVILTYFLLGFFVSMIVQRLLNG